MQRFDESLFRLFIEGLARHTVARMPSKPVAHIEMLYVLTTLL